MAQTSYTTRQITVDTRKHAYSRLSQLIDHLPYFQGIDLVSITRNADNTITIVLSNPIPLGQLEHLGLD